MDRDTASLPHKPTKGADRTYLLPKEADEFADGSVMAQMTCLGRKHQQHNKVTNVHMLILLTRPEKGELLISDLSVVSQTYENRQLFLKVLNKICVCVNDPLWFLSVLNILAVSLISFYRS